jgi:hypothetical protein
MTALYADPSGEVLYTYFNVTGQADPSPAPPPGSVLINDPLNSDQGNLPNDGTQFQQDGYHMTGDFIAPYGYNNAAAANSDIAVTAIHSAGSTTDAIGIAFRHGSPGNSYLFVLSTNGGMGFFKLVHSRFTLISAFKPGVITRTGNGAINTLEVRAQGSAFSFYLNDVNVGSAEDSTFSAGLPGLVSLGGETVFTDFYVTSGS